MKKHPNLRGMAMLALFLLGFALLLAFANVHLIQTDTIARLTIYEMQQRSDIELALVGSSIVRDHFNAPMITELTEKNAFCATIPTASTPAPSLSALSIHSTSNTAQYSFFITVRASESAK